MIAHGWYTGVAACTRVNASGSRNTPCKLQRSSSDQCTSSGVSVSDHAKCVSQATCMHTRSQRYFGSQPSIVNLYARASALRFISCVPTPVCLLIVSLGFENGSVRTVWNSTVQFLNKLVVGTGFWTCILSPVFWAGLSQINRFWTNRIPAAVQDIESRVND